ncbi:DoxX family protein [Caldalkalibacillus mannanilyticus]|uniref:DoxX family protein n=1 Tax=Caldalkalibacillus mannanilyticus TaxID=1418 RepID=UPI000469D426|nr:DoxX family protein [Caldalkalibacillus mannanilyticus]
MTKKYEIGAFILRVVVGLIFFIHGLEKFQNGVENLAGWFGSIGIPGFLAYVVTYGELVGGLALILGLGTRLFSLLFGIIMIGAIATVKFPAGLTGNGEMAGYEFDLTLLAMSIHLVLNGSSWLSLDSLIRKKKGSNQKEASF